MTSDEFGKKEKIGFEPAMEEVAVEMIEAGEPFDKIQLTTKISIDRILQLAVDLKNKSKS